jgi:hypothetical protein
MTGDEVESAGNFKHHFRQKPKREALSLEKFTFFHLIQKQAFSGLSGSSLKK